MKRRNPFPSLRVAGGLAFVLLGSPAGAQVDLGRIDLTVEDTTGAMLPGAAVAIVGPEDRSNIFTDVQGEAHLLRLPVGTYEVRVTFAGFSTFNVEAFGPDVSFWHRSPSAEYSALLNEFMQLDVPFGEWDDRSFAVVLRDFQKRFAATDTEEGTVMATTLAFVLQDQRSSRQAQILAEFRTSPRILRLFERGKSVWEAFVGESLGAS